MACIVRQGGHYANGLDVTADQRRRGATMREMIRASSSLPGPRCCEPTDPKVTIWRQRSRDVRIGLAGLAGRQSQLHEGFVP